MSLDAWVQDYPPPLDPDEVLGEYSLLKCKTGHKEWETNPMYTIYHFEDHDIYIRFNGICGSLRNDYYSGEMFEVRPKHVKEIKYKKVK